MLSPEQLEARKAGIGGSDMAAIMGMSHGRQRPRSTTRNVVDTITRCQFTLLFNLCSEGHLRENITISNGLSQQASKRPWYKASQ